MEKAPGLTAYQIAGGMQLEHPLPELGGFSPGCRSSLPWERPWPIWTIWRPKGGSSARRYMENGYISPAWATKYE